MLGGVPLGEGVSGRLALDPAPTNLTQLRLQVAKFRISTSPEGLRSG